MDTRRDTSSAGATGTARSTGQTAQTAQTGYAAQRTATIVGVFEDRQRAQDAVAELERLGFSADEVGYAARDGDVERDASRTEVTTDTGSGSGALTGAATGGVLGGIVGAAAALLIPGVGPVVAAGILGPVLGAAAAGAGIGAVGGGVVGGLVTTGVSEEDARYYDEEFRAGRTLVTVRTEGREAEARRVLEQFGAYDVERQGSSLGTHRAQQGYQGSGLATGGRTWPEALPRFRRRWEQRYGMTGERWDEYEPAYQYGYEMRDDARFRGRDFDEVEADLRDEWHRRHGESAWERFRASVREAWDDVTD